MQVKCGVCFNLFGGGSAATKVSRPLPLGRHPLFEIAGLVQGVNINNLCASDKIASVRVKGMR
jgi:hypothetical protein